MQNKNILCLILIIFVGIFAFALVNSNHLNNNELVYAQADPDKEAVESNPQTENKDQSEDTTDETGTVSTIISVGGKNQFTGLSDYLSTLIKALFPIAISLAVLMIIYGGFKYISAGVDQGAVSSAKEIITQAIIGLVLLILINMIYHIIIQR